MSQKFLYVRHPGESRGPRHFALLDSGFHRNDGFGYVSDGFGYVKKRLVGGRVENGLTMNPYADASDRVSRFVYDCYRQGRGRERFFTTNNIALATESFRSLGGFTTAIPSATAEDKEFCDRWRARGLGFTHPTRSSITHTSSHLRDSCGSISTTVAVFSRSDSFGVRGPTPHSCPSRLDFMWGL